MRKGIFIMAIGHLLNISKATSCSNNSDCKETRDVPTCCGKKTTTNNFGTVTEKNVCVPFHFTKFKEMTFACNDNSAT